MVKCNGLTIIGMEKQLMIALLLELIQKLFFIYLAIAVGIVWRFSPLFKEEFGPIFTKICIWIFFPITILAVTLDMGSVEFYWVVVLGFIAIIIHVGGYIVIFLLNIHDPKSIGSQAMVASFPNLLLFPFPVILAIVGSDGLFFATLMVFYGLVLRNTLGIYIGVNHRELDEKENNNDDPLFLKEIKVKQVIIETLKFPPFIALIIGLVISFLFGNLHVGSNPIVSMSKDISMWGSLLLVGISFNNLDQLKPKNLFARSTLKVGIVRFLVIPTLTILLLVPLGFSNFIAFTVAIQATAPPAVSNIFYAHFFHLREDKVSIFITSLTFIALLILPVELLILQVIFPI